MPAFGVEPSATPDNATRTSVTSARASTTDSALHVNRARSAMFARYGRISMRFDRGPVLNGALPSQRRLDSPSTDTRSGRVFAGLPASGLPSCVNRCCNAEGNGNVQRPSTNGM